MNPYDEGYHAARKGMSWDDNPYVSESNAWKLWNRGFNEFWCNLYNHIDFNDIGKLYE